jgi:hypothetical protein
MEDSEKTLFCSSVFSWACDRISLKFLDNLGTRPQEDYPALVHTKAFSKTHSLNNLCFYKCSQVSHCVKEF